MNLRSVWASLPEKPVSDALEYITKRINLVFTKEHTPDGAHTNIHVQQIFEQGRTVAMGAWATELFNAANFTGNGAMTWAVLAGNVFTNRYTLIGKTLYWQLIMAGGVIGGVPNSSLRITLPGGFVAATQMAQACARAVDGGGVVDARAESAAGSTVVTVIKNNGVVWAAGATAVYFQMAIEVQ